MNTITNNSTRTIGIAFAALMLLALPFAAHAADLGDGGDYGSGDYYSSGDYGSGDYYPTTYSSGDYGSGDYYPTDYTTPTYTSPTYSTPSYSYPSYSYPSYSTPSYSSAPSNSNTNVNTNVNTNTCTNGSCNTSSSVNAPTTIVTNYPSQSQPVVYTPVYTPVYSYAVPPISTQTGCGYNVICPTAPTPYVSLSAVPYTGLDLGPVGTALYWGFLILWCLGAAYLIVIKRVQNKFVAALNGFLFGTTGKKEVQVVAHQTHAPVIKTVPAQTIFSGIDPFIASQISRAAF
jgi:hypothetical protein